VLNVVLSEHGLPTCLQLEELLINVLPMSTNLLCKRRGPDIES
jgi:hypothetical protein